MTIVSYVHTQNAGEVLKNDKDRLTTYAQDYYYSIVSNLEYLYFFTVMSRTEILGTNLINRLFHAPMDSNDRAQSLPVRCIL